MKSKDLLPIYYPLSSRELQTQCSLQLVFIYKSDFHTALLRLFSICCCKLLFFSMFHFCFVWDLLFFILLMLSCDGCSTNIASKSKKTFSQAWEMRHNNRDRRRIMIMFLLGFKGEAFSCLQGEGVKI